MQPGDKITIYHDPITQKAPEGEVELLEKLEDAGGGGEYWRVKFLDGTGDVRARIITGEEIESNQSTKPKLQRIGKDGLRESAPKEKTEETTTEIYTKYACNKCKFTWYTTEIDGIDIYDRKECPQCCSDDTFIYSKETPEGKLIQSPWSEHTPNNLTVFPKKEEE